MSLPPDKETQWKAWTDSLIELEQVFIQRVYIPDSMSHYKWKELCGFSDASPMAIAAVAYLRVMDSDGKWHVGFIMGKSKLARSLLCAHRATPGVMHSSFGS